jgi:predicted ester cyclase
MSVEGNKAVARRWFEEVINGRKPEVVDEIFAPSYVHHGTVGDGMRRAEVKKFAASILAAYPDRKATIEDIVAEDDRVVVRFSSTGTRQGEFMGRPATGKRESMSAIWISRFENNRAVEGWEVADGGPLMQ